MKDCPYCANQIQDAAIKCQYCGELLEAPARAPIDVPARAARRRIHPLLVLYVLLGCAAYVAAAFYLRDQERPLGAAAAVGAAIVFVLLAPAAWAIGDVIRRFANPSGYFVSGGAMALAQTRLYWLVGPQSVAVFVVFAALGAGVLRASMPDMVSKPTTTVSPIEASTEQGAPAAKADTPRPAQVVPAVEPQTSSDAASAATSTLAPEAVPAPAPAN